MSDLHARATEAFDAEFRDRLCNAVTLAVLQGVEILPPGVGPRVMRPGAICKCPEGCVATGNPHPSSKYMLHYFGFTREQHIHFQVAFDGGCDRGTPESALGLLYRQRFVTSPLPARVRSTDEPGEET